MVSQHRLATAFDDADDSTGLLLWKLTNAWQAAQRKALQPFELTHVQFVLLASLTWLHSEEPVTQRALAEHAGTDAMMTSQVLRALESKGLIERRSHRTDGRARTLLVTKRGEALANQAVGVVEGIDRKFFGPLGDAHKQFTEMLSRILASCAGAVEPDAGQTM